MQSGTALCGVNAAKQVTSPCGKENQYEEANRVSDHET